MSTVHDLLTNPPAASGYCVAFSGGMDSTVLLHLAHAAELPNLSAIHIHHGLQVAADDWAVHCQQQCQTLGVPLQVVRVVVPEHHVQGPEAAAREARYAALGEHLPEGAALLTAHHVSDQAETVLLRLLRGTGIEGLVAMPVLMSRRFGSRTYLHWRPLLKTSQAVIKAYAQQHQLSWIEDPHNSDPRYARSWLRQAALPALRARYAETDAQLARIADHAADAAELLLGQAIQLLPAVLGPHGGLSIKALLKLTAPQRRLVLRHWFETKGLPKPPARQLQQLDTEVLTAVVDAVPSLRWPGVECRRYRDGLFADAPLSALTTDLRLDWDGQSPLSLPAGLGTLSSSTPRAMQVRFSVPGLRLKLGGHQHHRMLSMLCQESDVPPWWRSRLPIIFVNDTVVSIAGRWNTAEAPPLRWQIQPTLGLPAHWQP